MAATQPQSELSAADLQALLDKLLQGMDAVANDNLDYQLNLEAETVLGRKLGDQFEKMLRALKKNIHRQQQERQAEADETEHLTQALEDAETRYRTLFEQTRESLAETKALYLSSRATATVEDLPHVLETVVDSVANVLSADRVMLITLEDAEVSHIVIGGPGAEQDDNMPLDDLAEGLISWVLRELEPALSPKGTPDPRESLKVQTRRAETNRGSTLVVPVMYGDRVVGTMTAVNRFDQPDFTEHDVKLMATISAQAANAIENARLYQQAQYEISRRAKTEKALERERDLLKSLLDNVPDYIFFKDAQLHFMRTNRAHAEQLLRLNDPQQAIGKTDFDFYAAEDAQRQFAEEQEIIRTGNPSMARERQVTAADGNRIWISEHKIPMKDDAGRVVGLVGIGRDITAIKNVEQALARRVTELETVAEVSAAVSSILDTDELLQQVVDLTKVRFNLYHAHIYLLVDEMLTLVAGADKVGRQMVAEGWRIPLERAQSLVARAARTGGAVVVNNVSQEADYFQNPLLLRTRSEMAIPLLVGEAVLGVLDVQADTEDYFTDDDIRVYTSLGAQIAVALQNARSFSRAQATLAETEALYNISKALNTIERLSDLLQAVTDMVVGALPSTWATLITVDVSVQQIEAAVASGPDAERVLPTSFDALMAGLGGWAITEGQSILSPKGVPDSRESLELQQYRFQNGIGAVAAVPLSYQNKILGVLAAYNTINGRNFTSQDLSLMVAIANQVANAVENRHLLAQAQRRAEREQAIREVTEKLRAAPNLDALLDVAARELGRRLDVHHAVVELGIGEVEG